MNQTDIVDIISSKISLVKHGKNYVALCPFHKEKTPSFTVNPEKEFYHCFGCGVHGGYREFLEKFNTQTEKVVFDETATDLSEEKENLKHILKKLLDLLSKDK